ncbi:MAG: DUF3748 domain-containing protein, partial [Pricia sp.]|nr:DUF3748 domain-containing protein [Pricia sp.]
MSSLMLGCEQKHFKTERQITHDSYNHDLDNNDNFSPDDQWLVYDTRTEKGGIGANGKIEKVHIETGEKVVLYVVEGQTEHGPGVGAVSYSHTKNEVVFIHGLLNCSADKPYAQWRRIGVIVRDSAPGIPIFMDARNISAPFTPGALRGGTHRHEWSGDGQWIGFTYNDALMKTREDSTGIAYNLRTIGVSKAGRKVSIAKNNEGENISGDWFSALVVNVIPDPALGSDEISRAAGDSWVGVSGYKKRDGTRQRARAFIGTTKSSEGKNIDEVFIVDIPEDISIANENEPLEGTATTFPSPPKGTVQRRLTYTADTKYPGCEGIVRSSHDGSKLAFLAYDDQNIKQVFTISPLGGTPVQQTFHPSDVESGVRWHPSENRICYVWNGIIARLKIGEKKADILTRPSKQPATSPVWSHDGKTIAYNRLVTDD